MGRTPKDGGVFARRFERVTFRTIVVCAALLFLAQFIVLNRGWGQTSWDVDTLDGWLGVSSPRAAADGQGGNGASYLVLMLTNGNGSSDAAVSVDGVRVPFTQPFVRVWVREGQSVRVSAGKEAVRVRVIASSPDVIEPRLGREVSCTRGSALVGRVQLMGNINRQQMFEGHFGGKEE